MTHTINTVTDHVEGESLTQEFTVEENNSPRDISGATVNWYLVASQGTASSNAKYDDTDSGINVSITNAASGRVDVEITQDTTSGDGDSRYWQRLVVDDDGSAGKQIWGGYFPIYEA